MWAARCVLLELPCGMCPFVQSLIESVLTELKYHRYESPAGLLITLYVYIVYIVALRFEG